MDYLLALLNRIGADPQLAQFAFIGLIGSAAAASVVAVVLLVRGVSDPARRRVASLAEQRSGRRTGAWQRLQERMGVYAPAFMPEDGAERSRMRETLIHAGYRTPGALQSFYALKTLLLLGLPALVFAATSFIPGLTTLQVSLAAAVAGSIGLLGPNMVLRRMVTARQRRLSVALPDALDLLVVCTEAGLGLKAAIQRVADELAVSHPDLASELAQVNAETRAGVERETALRNLSRRTGLEEFRGLVALLNQTLRFGTSVADALRIYAEEFRDQRMQRAEEAAAKIGTKMIFPLVMCLFPAFFLVSVGPAVIGVLNLFN